MKADRDKFTDPDDKDLPLLREYYVPMTVAVFSNNNLILISYN